MISVKNLRKTYNKRKRNERRVLDHVTLDFPSKGLVMILGDSGSGKTTLLNVMGGMDAADQGSVSIGVKVFSRYSPARIDLIRNESIGTVFQHYYLLPHETVYQNIRLTLHMIGLSDEQEINARINYLLDLVNMRHYKMRRANQLSGGQQQRIAIVRALAKDPDVILADEPTGNLDSRNTLEIMKILKTISKDKLVVMVTHEQNLAKHYADAIVEIEDGKILTHTENGAPTHLDERFEHDIYLGDLQKIGGSDTEKTAIEAYADESLDKTLKVRLIVKNNTLYLDYDKNTFQTVHHLDEQSEISVHEGRRAEEAAPEKKERTFDYAKRFPIDTKKSRSVFRFKHLFARAFAKIRESSRLSKLLYAGFAFGAALFAFALYILANIVVIDDSEFLEHPKTTFTITDGAHETYEDFAAAYSHSAIDGMNLLAEKRVRLVLPNFYQTPKTVDFVKHVAPLELADEEDLFAGRFPEESGEMLMTKTLAEEIVENDYYRAMGLTSYARLVNIAFATNVTRAGDQHPEEEYGQPVLPDELPFNFRIVGIVEDKASMFYADERMIGFLLSDDLAPVSFFDDVEGFEVLQGTTPLAENEVMIPHQEGIDPIGEDRLIHDRDFEIVGTYRIEGVDINRLLLSEEGLLAHHYIRTHAINTERYVYTDAPTVLAEFLSEEGANYTNLYDEARNTIRQERAAAMSGLLVFAFIVLAATALSFYFIIRSSMMKRIYEIGVYRSLGVKRADVLKLFAVETFLLTTISSLLGFLAMTYALFRIQREAAAVIELFSVSAPLALLGIGILYFINLFFGLLPLSMVLRKTPAQIMSAYDL